MLSRRLMHLCLCIVTLVTLSSCSSEVGSPGPIVPRPSTDSVTEDVAAAPILLSGEAPEAPDSGVISLTAGTSNEADIVENARFEFDGANFIVRIPTESLATELITADGQVNATVELSVGETTQWVSHAELVLVRDATGTPMAWIDTDEAALLDPSSLQPSIDDKPGLIVAEEDFPRAVPLHQITVADWQETP